MPEKKKKKKLVKWKESPFTESLAVPVGHKMVKLMDGKKEKTALINIETGEEQMTGVFSFKKVDNQQFVKMFTENIAITHGLNLAGRKACDILQFAVQDHAINKDKIWLGLAVVEEFNTHVAKHGVKPVSDSVFYDGINQLIMGGILARCDSGRAGDYWLNCNILFNGNRLAMLSIIERDVTLVHGEVVEDANPMLTEDKQMDLLEE